MSIKKNNEIIAGKYRHQVVPYASNTVAGIIRIATSAELIPTATTLAITPSQVLELLATKQNTLTAGSNIQINNNTISATNTTYTAGSGLTLTGTQFSANVVNSTSSTSTANALSANMGKELQDQINNLKSLGTYLSNWNCTTGLAETDPTISPRPYHSGDYFLVGTIATTGTNYRPSGTEYVIGQASTAVETETVAVGDCYIYDGTTWKLQLNTKRTVTFNTIAGSPYDNSDLASALNAKQNTLTAGTDISIVNNTVNFTGTIPTKISDLTDDTSTNPVDKADTLTGLTASITELNFTDGVTSNIQSQLNNKQGTLSAGSNIQIVNGIISATDTKYTAGTGISITDNVISNTQTSAEWGNITGTLANQTDLNTALEGKQETLVSGTNIKTINNNSLLGSGDIEIKATPDNSTISLNSSDELQTIGVVDQNTGIKKFWSGTKAEYDAITTKDSNTLYNVKGDNEAIAYNAYTKAQTNALLNTKANASDVYTKTEDNALLNAKLNADHSNDTKPYLKTCYVNGTSGYNIWSNGYCEQWGQTSGVDITVTFLKEFSNTNYNIVGNEIMSSPTAEYELSIVKSSTTQVRLYCDYGGSFSGIGACWKACGYLAEGEY